MNKIDRPAIEAKVRALKEHNKPILISCGTYRIKNAVSPLTALKNCTLPEAVALLTEEYAAAALSFGCDLTDVRLVKDGGAGAYLTASRYRTEEETEKSVQQEVDWRIELIRGRWKREASDKSSKKRQILKLQEQLKALEK